MKTQNIIELTDKNFDEIVTKHNLLVIDFWAEWCAPCKDFEKVVEQVASDYPEFLFAGVDIESQAELVEDFNVRSVPAVMIMRDNVVLFAETGALSAANLRELLEKTKAIDPDELAKSKE